MELEVVEVQQHQRMPNWTVCTLDNGKIIVVRKPIGSSLPDIKAGNRIVVRSQGIEANGKVKTVYWLVGIDTI